MVVRGTKDIPISDKVTVENLIMEKIKEWRTPGSSGESPMAIQHKYGTSISTYNSAHSGDSPVKNWGGIGVIDLPDREGLHHDVFASHVEKVRGCWHCPMACPPSNLAYGHPFPNICILSHLPSKSLYKP